MMRNCLAKKGLRWRNRELPYSTFLIKVRKYQLVLDNEKSLFQAFRKTRNPLRVANRLLDSFMYSHTLVRHAFTSTCGISFSTKTVLLTSPLKFLLHSTTTNKVDIDGNISFHVWTELLCSPLKGRVIPRIYFTAVKNVYNSSKILVRMPEYDAMGEQ